MYAYVLKLALPAVDVLIRVELIETIHLVIHVNLGIVVPQNQEDCVEGDPWVMERGNVGWNLLVGSESCNILSRCNREEEQSPALRSIQRTRSRHIDTDKENNKKDKLNGKH